MKSVASILSFCATAALAMFATAEPAPAPDLMLTLDGGLVSNSSSNFGPAIKQIIGDFNDDGPCEASNDWATCDALRFGLAIHSGPSCDDSDPLVVMYDPGEDVGIDYIEPRLTGLSSEDNGMSPTYCGGQDSSFRNHDTAQEAVWEATFPGTTSATDAQYDQYWERPHLQIFVTEVLPSSSGGAADNRVMNTLEQVCTMHAGPAGLPSMPTWVLIERNDTEPEVLYGGLVSAAGGTGNCEQLVDGMWTAIDVCAHIAEPGVDEDTVRTGIADGTYRCDAGGQSYKVGALDYRDAPGNQGLPVIKCHLDKNANCNSKPTTDLLGILSCVRQLPRGVSAADAIILYCPPGAVPGDDECVLLTEENGDIEWIDERKTLFVMTEKDNCQAGNVDISTCEPGLACDTVLEGRCAAGLTDCSTGSSVCVPIRGAFPEICNGLDDDCDGAADNMKESWGVGGPGENVTLPDDHQGLHCNELDVCTCKGGATETHDGTDWDSFLDSWIGLCTCGESLEAEPWSPAPQTDPYEADQAACTAVGSDEGVPAMFLALIALGFAPMLRRRK